MAGNIAVVLTFVLRFAGGGNILFVRLSVSLTGQKAVNGYQIGTSSSWGGRRYPPYAFTEQGVAMLSSVLRSKQAVRVNVEIMRTFVRLRRVLATHKELARKLEDLERKYDGQFRVVFEALRQLMTPPERPRKRIGFVTE